MIETSARDIVNTIFKHKWQILLVTLLVFAGVGAYTFLVQELYRSEAQLMVQKGREVMDTDPSIGQPVAVLTNLEAEVRSETALLENRQLARRLVEALGPEAFLLKPDEIQIDADGTLRAQARTTRGILRGIKAGVESVLVSLDILPERTDTDKAIDAIMENLTVEVQRGSQVIDVSYDAPGAELAQYILNSLLLLYYADHVQTYGTMAGPEFFQTRLASAEAALREKEQELQAFRDENKIISLQSQKDALLERINQLEADATSLAANARASEARLASLEAANQGRKPTREVSRTVRNVNPVRDNLQESIANLRVEEKALASRYPDDHREVQRVRAQIQDLESIRGTLERDRYEVTTGTDTVYEDLLVAMEQERGEMEGARAAQAILDQELVIARQRLAEFGDFEVRLNRLEREINVAQQEYEAARDSLNRAQKSQQLDEAKVSNIREVQSPSLPTSPYFPDKPLNLGLGLLLGLLAGLFLAFVIEYFDDRLGSREKVQARLGVPVLASISEEEYKACT